MATLIRRVPELRSQLRAQLAERLRLGVYADDVLLQEHGVAREFDVSRTPAREALAMLERDGVLTRVGRGYRRARHTVPDIEEVFELRARLEPYAARLAAEGATAQELSALRSAGDRAWAAAADAQAFMLALADLRRKLFAAAHNPSLTQLIERYEGQVAYIRGRTLRDDATRQVSAEANRRLVDAVLARDGAHAEAVMSANLNLAREAILRTLPPDPPLRPPLERTAR
jgi:DNA-binding GntR family transcriptional regulator